MTSNLKNGTHKPPVSDPDPQVTPQTTRRRFTAKYKLKVLQEADQCQASGEIGALLRREGLYSSHLTKWRRQRTAGELAGLKEQPRGRKVKQTAESGENSRLKRENDHLKEKLRQANLIIDAQKKLSQLLETIR